MKSIFDENAIPVCITLTKAVQFNWNEPIQNATVQFKDLFDENFDFKKQTLDFLKNNLDEKLFSGQVYVILSKFDKSFLVELRNNKDLDVNLKNEYLRKFKESEKIILDFTVWIKHQITVEEIEDAEIV